MSFTTLMEGNEFSSLPGLLFLLTMHVEVDQSGKIEDTKVDTALAFSNDISRAILVPSTVKRQCVRSFRKEYKSGKIFYLRLFTVGLFLLLKDDFDKLNLITVDIEYKSRSRDIKRLLLYYLRRIYPHVDRNKVRFKRISRKSEAHRIAIETFRGNLTPDKTVKVEDMMEWIK